MVMEREERSRELRVEEKKRRRRESSGAERAGWRMTLFQCGRRGEASSTAAACTPAVLAAAADTGARTSSRPEQAVLLRLHESRLGSRDGARAMLCRAAVQPRLHTHCRPPHGPMPTCRLGSTSLALGRERPTQPLSPCDDFGDFGPTTHSSTRTGGCCTWARVHRTGHVAHLVKHCAAGVARDHEFYRAVAARGENGAWRSALTDTALQLASPWMGPPGGVTSGERQRVSRSVEPKLPDGRDHTLSMTVQCTATATRRSTLGGLATDRSARTARIQAEMRSFE